MADSIDRVFSKAVTTIKTLSTKSGSGSLPRPPVETRIKLYGLYKQATEGNISEDLLNSGAIEDEAILRKYNSWHSNLNLSQTEAKKKYIEVLISTMKVYASGTMESRELLTELEFLYDQIKDLQEDSISDDLKSPELFYNSQFQYPDQLKLRNLSQSTNNLMDSRSAYDKNDSIYSYPYHHHNHNDNNEINTSWKNEINSIINKIIKDLNFVKRLERQRESERVRAKRYSLIKSFLQVVGYTAVNLIVMLLLLKLNKRIQFLNALIG